jgi:hypothetical protein
VAAFLNELWPEVKWKFVFERMAWYIVEMINMCAVGDRRGFVRALVAYNLFYLAYLMKYYDDIRMISCSDIVGTLCSTLARQHRPCTCAEHVSSALATNLSIFQRMYGDVVKLSTRIWHRREKCDVME